MAVLAFGAARLRYEAGIRDDLRAAGLTAPVLELGTRERIGQTSSAVALGGLRTLVATFLNLRAFTFFQEQRWDDVASTFDTVVDLAPRTRYYWVTGSWHSAYNAASYYLNDSTLPALRRREEWRTSILRGREFLERGIRNNPHDWQLKAELGFLLSDSNKFGAFHRPEEALAAAAETYRLAGMSKDATGFIPRAQLYALARVPGKEAEALALARQLYTQKFNRVPTLLTLLFVLEAHENPAMDAGKRATEIFGTPEKAYEALKVHWRRIRERFPIYGVAEGLASLEKNLAIPAEQSALNQPLPPIQGPEEWFAK